MPVHWVSGCAAVLVVATASGSGPPGLSLRLSPSRRGFATGSDGPAAVPRPPFPGPAGGLRFRVNFKLKLKTRNRWQTRTRRLRLPVGLGPLALTSKLLSISSCELELAGQALTTSSSTLVQLAVCESVRGVARVQLYDFPHDSSLHSKLFHSDGLIRRNFSPAEGVPSAR